MGRWILAGLFLWSLVISGWWLADKNVLFHSDIARDFYLMREVVVTGKPTLIGPRSGGVAGLFHGPLWVYLNLPVFIGFAGNPLALAVYWFGLHWLTVWLVWRLTNNPWAGAVYALVAAVDVHSFNNPQGAVILAPIWFVVVYKLWEKPKVKLVFWAFFLTGLLIQFQAAFGGPMLLFLLGLLIVKMVKGKNWRLVWGILGIVLPLLSYLGFEVRHNFLMTRAVISYGGRAGEGADWGKMLLDRWQMLWYYGWGMLGKYWWGMVIGLVGTVLAARKDKKARFFWILWGFYWLSSLMFRGRLPVWYYNQFLPLMVMVLMGAKFEGKKLILLGLIAANSLYFFRDIAGYNFLAKQGVWTSWKSLSSAGSWVKENCGRDFGLYTFTPDLFGYPLRYAVEYEMGFKGYAINEKREVVCVLLAPEVVEHPGAREQWLKNEVKIMKVPILVEDWPNGIRLQKYLLTEEEQKVESNPLMIKDVFFR